MKAIPGVRIGALDQALRREEGDEDHEGEDVVENLVDIVNRNAELFHDSSKECFARFEQDEHQENWNLESKGFKEWLSYQFFNLNRRSPSEQSIKAAISDGSSLANCNLSPLSGWRKPRRQACSAWRPSRRAAAVAGTAR